ncbi:DNA internalization-related competence protein ComEC/Rec2 [Mechercharimyces sp. CAU 1602]|uniref:DNA internalization-related competence protein ComEC/Rec2 n=1 Tax=Mechercharimyces sp. CAU 1602 TaxID=2973933 RepID=UPI00216398BD|nr:DNA internalization-related competence protein ComEC/Rec2 [Mechercharimyces sp. CAU 1602]MCS1350430.1 DNA internalization-related competence protein ComEC/Rec2 [Mechercharimyces sp. CAU 1602]
MRRPLVILAVGQILGIVGATYLPAPLILGLSGLGTVLVWGGWLYYNDRQLFMLALFLVSWTFGAVHYIWLDGRNNSELTQVLGLNSAPTSSKEQTYQVLISGEIGSPPLVDGDQVRFRLVVEELSQQGEPVLAIQNEEVMVWVRLQGQEEQEKVLAWKRGWKVQMPLELSLPLAATNPGAFDYKQYLYRQHIHWMGSHEGLDGIQLAEKESGQWLQAWFDEQRSRFSARIESLFPEQIAGLVKGMLLGLRTEVPYEIEEDFKRLGLVHILAISGLHVGVLVACIYSSLKWIGMIREVAAGVTLMLLPVYVLLTGAGIPVVRAAIMAGMMLVAVIFRKYTDSLSFLALASLCILLCNPYALFTAGYQLSFVLTWALVVGVSPLRRLLLAPKWISAVMAVTIIAQLASFPLAILHFHQYSLLSAVSNFLLVPIISLIVIPGAFLSLLLSAFPLGEVFAFLPSWIVSTVLTYLLALTEVISQWRFLHWSWRPPSLWWISLYGLICVLVFLVETSVMKSRWRARIVSYSLFLLVCGYAVHPWGTESLRVTFLDVGQGDAIVIETPVGYTMLIDGGGVLPFQKEKWQERRRPQDPGQSVVVPYLTYRGVRQLDLIVLTHGDQDHMGGVFAVMDRFPVKHVLYGGGLDESPEGITLLHQLHEQGSRVEMATDGQSQEVEEGITWTILHPSATEGIEQKGRNDASVVLYLQAYGYQLLFTGDIEAEGEEEIVTKWELTAVDVLKVAHHGSRTSSTSLFMKRVKPQVAIISAGRKNRYGHPAPEVVERIETEGSTLFRTDEHGAITILISEQGMLIETMR